MDSLMCSSAPDPEMWIIQGTLAWIDEVIRVRFNVDPTFDSLVGSGRSGWSTTTPLFSIIHTSLISVC
ncbi:hypothetical protein EJD97_005540 [Solanum chilense]|uniref:Uncharacterized protein ycf68 n=1 Tax=Solanum chilense TaxID=4083 RepID=A0A6N2BU81_SOLCI|nr:hypothetical protein EJD97_005540 [Solanum chilense]